MTDPGSTLAVTGPKSVPTTHTANEAQRIPSIEIEAADVFVATRIENEECGTRKRAVPP